MLLLIATLILGPIAVWLFIRGTVFSLKYSEEWIRNSRPTVFPRPVMCERCEQPVGRFGRLSSIRETILGGWTCPKCGSEFDQLDNIRVARAWNANLRDMERRSLHGKVPATREDGRSPVERLFDE